ncbi:MAG: hypothetical protein ACI9NI_002624 [Olleya marilimosa]|jgi:hypothetical protein
MSLLNLAILLSSCAFLFYGINCLVSQTMKDEFVRFGLDKQRQLTGILQLLGALGLILGYFLFPIVTVIAAAGLSILMFLGFLVRIKIKDSILQSLPSLLFAVINLYISVQYYYKIIS